MIIGDPFKRVGDEEAPDFIAVSIVKVQRRTPWRFVALAEVRSELRQTIPFRTDVVVDHIQDRSQTSLMTDIDQRLEAAGTAVRILNRVGKYAVIAPVSCSWKLRDRHQLNGSNSNTDELVEVWDDGFERSGGSERSNMQFIDDVIFNREPEPMGVSPLEARIHDLRRTKYAVRLIPGYRVRKLRAIVQSIDIPCPRRH